ncbi:TonB-dependent hemoglobin/transferrin/lactoferrin family receptor [Vibrio sp. RC27]
MFNKTKIAVVIGGLFALPTMVNAETSILEEVVVTATRTEQTKKDVSSSITTVSSETLDKNLVGDLKQALTYSPGVDAIGSGRFGISGINIRGVEESRVKMMVDGVQQPSSYNPGSTEQRKYPNTIEVDTLQSIEVNKGPSSTLYGSDALGGVVLMRTKNPEDLLITDENEHRFGVKTGYASASDEFKTTLSWAMRKDKLETLLMATYSQGHETETHSSGLDVEGTERGAANPADKQVSNLLGKAFYQVNDTHRIGVTLEYYNHQYDEDELNYNGVSLGPQFTYTDNYNEDVNERFRIGFEHNMLMNSAYADSLDWSIDYQDSRSLSKNYDTTPLYGFRMRERDSSDKSIQLNAQLSKLIIASNSSHEITYGANYVGNDFSLDNTDHFYDLGTESPGSTSIPDATVTQLGVFVQDQAYLMDDRLVLTAGLRYDSFTADPSTDAGYSTEFDKNEDSAITGKLGSVYHLNQQLSLFGQISQGFKAPTVYDLYYSYNQGAVFEANPDLKAERSTAYEIGLRGEYNSTSFEVATFYNDYTDFITQEITGQDGGRDVYTKMNLDEVEIYGIEFGSKVRLDQAFSAPEGSYARLSVAYLDGQDKKTKSSLDSVAPLTSVVGFGLDRESYGTALNVKWVATKDEWQSEENVDAPSYTTVDLTAYYRPMNDLTVTAGLFNAFDEKYWLYSDLSGRTGSGFNLNSIDSVSQPGRNWGVSVDYQF